MEAPPSAKHKTVFLSILSIVWLTGLLIAILLPKGDLLIALNQYQSPSLDLFFRYATELGNGLFVIVAGILLLLFVEIRLGLMILIAYASSGIMAQVIKQTLSWPRPKGFLPHFDQLRLMEDMYFASQHSFPSGHTTSAFAFFGILAFSSKWNTPFFQVIFALLAIIAGISRVYLLQHFLMDVVAGAFLGVFFAFLTEKLLHRSFSKEKLTRPLILLSRNSNKI